MKEDNKSSLPGHVGQDLAHRSSWPASAVSMTTQGRVCVGACVCVCVLQISRRRCFCELRILGVRLKPETCACPSVCARSESRRGDMIYV